MSSWYRTGAAALGCYDALAVGDLNDKTCYADPAVAAAAPYDLVAAADVLCYFGALDDVLALWAGILRPGGDCIFSCERAPGDREWLLGPTGRYAHSPSYVAAAAARAGLSCASTTDIVPRVENGEAVPGTLYVLQKAP